MARRRPSRRSPQGVRLRPRQLALAILVLLAVLALERFGLISTEGEPVPADIAAPVPATDGQHLPPRLDEVEKELAAIRVEPEVRRGYQREDWPHWLDLDGDCLNTREEVLISESREPARLTPDGCGVLAGRWIDPYTAEVFTDPKALDVDHVVALQEAHDSGGHAWDRERRAAFANDLGDARSLLAVSRAANRAKGAKGPEDWLPPEDRYRCRYVADWVGIKARWRLSMDESERQAIGNILADCHRRAEVAERS